MAQDTAGRRPTCHRTRPCQTAFGLKGDCYSSKKTLSPLPGRWFRLQTLIKPGGVIRPTITMVSQENPKTSRRPVPGTTSIARGPLWAGDAVLFTRKIQRPFFLAEVTSDSLARCKFPLIRAHIQVHNVTNRVD
jgi:hypothetical protein